jgi:P4 family phage/plasmid primase-like protien
MADSIKIEFSLGKDKFDNTPQQHAAETFNDFKNAVLGNRSSHKGEKYFCCGFKHGSHQDKSKFPAVAAYRNKTLAKPRAFLVFDFDGFSDTETYTCVTTFLNNYLGFGYETWSHTSTSPRARAVLALNRPVNNDESLVISKRVEEEINESINNGSIKFDPCVYNIYQPIYGPPINANDYTFNGQLIDVDELLKSSNTTTNITQSHNVKNFSIKTDLMYSALKPEALIEVLSKIDNTSGYEEWSDVALALARVYGTSGRDIFLKWSRGDYTGKPYLSFNCIEVDKRYKTALNEVQGSDGYGVKHLIQLASYTATADDFETPMYPPMNIPGTPPNVTKLENEVIFGDKQNAELFASTYRGQLLFVFPISKWFRWNGATWSECLGGEIEVAAKDVSNRIADAAIELFKAGENTKSKKLLNHATKAQNLHQINAMLMLARSEEGLHLNTLEQLNKDPLLIGVKNGVVNLSTGQAIQPEQHQYITKQCNARFDPKASCQSWLKFLNDTFDNDQELIDSVQRLLGYTLTGSVTEEIMVICYGYGANGKSVMSNVIHHVLGEYSKIGSASILKRRRDDDSSPRSDIASLIGSRYISLNEMQNGDRLDDQVVKMLAGREPISARELYKEHISFTPTGKVWLKTNHKPIVLGDDDGIWRRLVILPFNRKFEPHERDPMLEDKLIKEADGILMWMIEGATLWCKDGLHLCEKITRECSSYRTESDILGQFIEESVNLAPSLKTQDKKLFSAYQHYCVQNGNHPLSKARFSQKLRERGIGIRPSNGQRFYVGAELKVGVYTPYYC